MLTKLDPHSGYLKPNDVSGADSATGSFDGIGIEMDGDGLIKVIAPIDDCRRRAESAGTSSHT